MTSLAVRWLHHSTAPSRRTSWFARACVVAVLIVAAASAVGATVLWRRDPLEGIYAPIVTWGWVAGLACISSMALIATVLSSLKVDSGDLLTAFPVSRRALRAILGTHTILVQGVCAALLLPSSAVVLARSTDVPVAAALVTALAGFASGTVVGAALASVSGHLARVLHRPALLPAGVVALWLVWFLATGASLRALVEGSLPAGRLPLVWPAVFLFEPGTALQPALCAALAAAAALAAYELISHLPDLPEGSTAWREHAFDPSPTAAALLVRASRSPRVRSQIIAGTTLTVLFAGGGQVWSSLQVPGALTLFGALFCAGVVAQVRLLSGPLPVDWILGQRPASTAVPHLVVGVVLSLPLMAITGAGVAISEGARPAAVAVLCCLTASAASLLAVTWFRPTATNSSAEVVVTVVVMSALLGLLRVLPADPNGAPTVPATGLATVLAVAVSLVVVRALDERLWQQHRA